VRAPDPAHPDDLMRMASVLNYKAARVNISVCEVLSGAVDGDGGQ